MDEQKSTLHVDDEHGQLVEFLDSVLVDPNVHTDTRMRLHQEIEALLCGANRDLCPDTSATRSEWTPETAIEHLPELVGSVLVDPNIHTDARMQLHREIRELLERTVEGSPQA
jgi:hypothetical protein